MAEKFAGKYTCACGNIYGFSDVSYAAEVILLNPSGILLLFKEKLLKKRDWFSACVSKILKKICSKYGSTPPDLHLLLNEKEKAPEFITGNFCKK